MDKKVRKLSKRTIALLAAAVIMFGTGGTMGARAALNVVSANYDATITTDSIRVTLVENDQELGKSDTLLKDGFADTKGKLVPGYPYQEKLAVKNSGTAPEYVRLIVRKYWMVENETAMNVEPTDIELTIGGTAGKIGTNWKENASERTAERSVYYYGKELGAGETTAALFDTLSVNGALLEDYEVIITPKEEGGNIYTYKYNFEGYTVCLEAEAQSVQTHNYKDAMKSVWGVDASSVL